MADILALYNLHKMLDIVKNQMMLVRCCIADCLCGQIKKDNKIIKLYLPCFSPRTGTIIRTSTASAIMVDSPKACETYAFMTTYDYEKHNE